MSRLKDFARIYVIYRQCNGPIRALRMAWLVARD